MREEEKRYYVVDDKQLLAITLDRNRSIAICDFLWSKLSKADQELMENFGVVSAYDEEDLGDIYFSDVEYSIKGMNEEDEDI